MPPRAPAGRVRQPAAAARYLVFGAAALAGLNGCDDAAGTTTADAAADAAVADAAVADLASTPETGIADAGAEAPPSAYPRPQYQRLSETGLYADFAARVVAPGNRRFRPAHELWSDAADKQRWVRLPEGTRIDTSEMDHWQFPVGTKLWKEFGRQGAALETRLVERYGPGPEDYWMGAFVWAADGSEATFTEEGTRDINGTTHDAPAAKHCLSCHRGDKGRVLGLSAVQLADAGPGGGLSLDQLVSEDLLTHPPAGPRYAVPGDAVTAAALGYLHANCGTCHNRDGAAWPDTQAIMRLSWEERTPEATGIVRTLVNRRFTYWRHPTLTLQVAPGDVEQSALVVRMRTRGSKDQMPPLASEIVDPAGLDVISRWIAGLPVPPLEASDAGVADAGVAADGAAADGP